MPIRRDIPLAFAVELLLTGALLLVHFVYRDISADINPGLTVSVRSHTTGNARYARPNDDGVALLAFVR